MAKLENTAVCVRIDIHLQPVSQLVWVEAAGVLAGDNDIIRTMAPAIGIFLGRTALPLPLLLFQRNRAVLKGILTSGRGTRRLIRSRQPKIPSFAMRRRGVSGINRVLSRTQGTIQIGWSSRGRRDPLARRRNPGPAAGQRSVRSVRCGRNGGSTRGGGRMRSRLSARALFGTRCLDRSAVGIKVRPRLGRSGCRRSTVQDGHAGLVDNRNILCNRPLFRFGGTWLGGSGDNSSGGSRVRDG
ncbi:hypothetical protein AG1IA_01488 [Rhizoctonia solani AG-1 IA]|uniref:Uncharacterized protein n=1 Tax=Thanatephorus cucumeris (strain AG1-IA) TaxID=983506 RepID=L8X5V7_THACA|nr:hypothetical protein AG1IA_01488 [Rhizoctonia solani AG-1 IA]